MAYHYQVVKILKNGYSVSQMMEMNSSIDKFLMARESEINGDPMSIGVEAQRFIERPLQTVLPTD